ncbi:MAG: ATP-binding protein [Clostridia bacterium]|nr:ATP-binding protein [Clostridia bacterium]
MLLNFSCDNFKSFRDGFQFSMIPETRMKELDYSILREETDGQKAAGLSASVIYGPNASGKTSIVNAMSCIRQIVLRGHIRDAADNRSGDRVSGELALAPFAFRDDAAPVWFDITFMFHGRKYRYAVAAFLGDFLERQAERYIDREQLYVNDVLIFDRTKDAVKKLKLDTIAGFLNAGYEIEDTEKTRRAMSNNITSDSLLLRTDFNSFCSKRLVSEIRQWFEDQLIVVNASSRARFSPGLPEDNVLINRIAQEAGITGSEFACVHDPETHATKLISGLQKTDGKVCWLDADRIESSGTMRLISIMPLVLSALRKGAVLVMDEMDASLHPVTMMNLITIFHNDKVNTNGAQLIFNTHNPIYLNHSLLRRDEIRFVERNRETKSSSLYALSDFRANGETSVRQTDDYMKNYFLGRYGALEDMDFTDIIMDALKGAGSETEEDIGMQRVYHVGPRG